MKPAAPPEVPRLTAQELLALRKCEAAERCTTVHGEVTDNMVYIRLRRRGLCEWRDGMRLSKTGRAVLEKLR